MASSDHPLFINCANITIVLLRHVMAARLPAVVCGHCAGPAGAGAQGAAGGSAGPDTHGGVLPGGGGVAVQGTGSWTAAEVARAAAGWSPADASVDGIAHSAASHGGCPTSGGGSVQCNHQYTAATACF